MTKYFTLLRRHQPTGLWGIEFGDYSRRVVNDEKWDLEDGSEAVHPKHLRVIVTPDDTQASIDRVVREINEAEAINAKASS